MEDLRSTIDQERGGRTATPTVVAEVLRRLILDGHFAAEQPLRQDEIASHFGISRIPVREAMRQLAAEGLVSLSERRGARVAALLPDEADELLEIRFTLEIRAMHLAMPHWRDATFDEAAAMLDESEAEACSIDRWSDLNRMFHEHLYRDCARPKLLGLITTLNAQVERYIRLLVSQSDYRLQAQSEHRAILASARVRNGASLAALIEQHAVQTGVALRRFLLDRPPAVRGRRPVDPR